MYSHAHTTAWFNARWWVNNPGHVLVVPNEHAENIDVVKGERAGEIHDTIRRIAFAMKVAYRCAGISTRQHDEPRPAAEERLPDAERLRATLAES